MATHRYMFRLLWALCLLVSFSAYGQFVQQGGKLFPFDSFGAATIGRSVSLSADGNTALVGGNGDNGSVGAAWVFVRTGSTWTQQAKLVGTAAIGTANQGISCALSADGTTAIVGGTDDNGAIGAAWVYGRTGSVWSQQGKLVGTGSVGSSNQGISVALSSDGNTALVGGYDDNANAGAVWVYVRAGVTWAQQGPKLVGAGAVGAAQQGRSVSLSADGNTAIEGAFSDNSSAGAAWVFTRSGGVWTPQGGKLVGTGAVGNAKQGTAVSISSDGNIALVGGYNDNSGAGATWVFTRSGGTWSQSGTKIVGSGASGPANQGAYLSLSGDGATAVVGGYADNGVVGAFWVFTRVGAVWTQQGDKLVSSGGIGPSLLGVSMAISGDGSTALAGGVLDNSSSGAAWVFVRDVPKITSVLDIPGDQGGSVRLRWNRFLFDSAGISTEITSYGVWRKIRPGGSVAAFKGALPPHEFAVAAESLSQYDFVTTVPAVQASSYNVVVPTLADSSASGVPYFTYLVTGQTASVYNYYMSTPDSGYSVDDLSPLPPAGILASVQAGPQVDLSWNAPTDPDVGSYKVYRSGSSGFTPAPGNIIGIATSTSFTDAAPPAGVVSYYKLVAVDVHDNASSPSNEVAATVPTTQLFGVQDKWNMVSVPLTVNDYSKSALFPTASTSAFGYDNGYFGYAVLENGRGYWVKFSSTQSISMTGLTRTLDTITVAEGWNMVGSLSASFSASTITSIPGGIVTGNFYGYDAGYQNSSTLEPGKGYWVKVSQAGQLIMNSGVSAPPANHIRIEDTGEKPPLPPDGSIATVGGTPKEYALTQNYPNPFNPTTAIAYSLPAAGHVTLVVYNMLGQEVATLVNGFQEAGEKSVSFDASKLPSGVYAYKMTAGTFTEVRRMVLLK